MLYFTLLIQFSLNDFESRVMPVSKPLLWTDLRRELTVFFLILLLPSLYGCIPAVVGGAIGGAELISEERTVQRFISDNNLEIKIRGLNKQDESLTNTNISVTVFNGWVLLIGEVASEEQKKKAEDTSKSFKETRRVINKLELSGLAGLGSGANDTIITGKVKSTMVVSQDVRATKIKVVTERGIVYLMGLVTKEEGERAVEVAKNISGVRKIVKVFEYLID